MRILMVSAIVGTLGLSSTAHAQFAPALAIGERDIALPYAGGTLHDSVSITVDPNDPSSVTWTYTNPIWKKVDHWYFNCLKKRWVWVSREFSRKGAHAWNPDEYVPSGPPSSDSALSPSTKELPSGPPPGSEPSAADPDRAFNPKTGQNFAKEPDGSWIDVKTGKTAVAPKLCPCPEPATTPQPPPPKTPKGAENTVCPEKKRTAMVQPPNSFDKRILDIHNEERAAVGAPPLQWNVQLAGDASSYAAEMARTGQLVHASREGRGIERENINTAFHGSSPEGLLRNWLNEKSYFHPGTFPNVCTSADWSQCAHYSQMIWPTTTDVGCGVASGIQWDFFVCRYSPGGNKDGKPVGEPVQIASGPCDETVGRTERGS